MHPAFSVIFLTTLIGVGQGLFLALFTGQFYALAKLLPAQDSQAFYAVGCVLSLGFLLAGLVASFFHLGHPERAWRAMTQWRTSWLSREVIILPITMLFIFLYGLAHFMGWNQPWFVLADGSLPVDTTLVMGMLATFATFLLFICTAMIYASLKFVQEWYNPLTVFNFIFLGGASGFTLAAAFSAYAQANMVSFYGMWAVILTLAALLTRGASLWRNRRLKHKSNLQTAIGIRHNKIQQKAQGSMGGSFNTREFFHHKPEKIVRMVYWFFLLFFFPIPIALLGASYGIESVYLPMLAFVMQYLGLMAERWYFFAEARHPQNLYYQAIA